MPARLSDEGDPHRGECHAQQKLEADGVGEKVAQESIAQKMLGYYVLLR
jgi:hypothetical protein